MFPIQRVKQLLITPKEEWPVIEAEQTTTKEILVKYLVILAAIPAVAGFLGMTLVGMNHPFFGTLRASFGSALATGVLHYLMQLGMALLAAMIIDELAPKFGAQKNFVQSFKLVAYSMTPGLVMGVFGLIPALSALGILGSLYGLYLFWIGLPVLKKPEPSKADTYALVSILVVIVTFVIVAVVVSQVGGPAMPKGIDTSEQKMLDLIKSTELLRDAVKAK